MHWAKYSKLIEVEAALKQAVGACLELENSLIGAGHGSQSKDFLFAEKVETALQGCWQEIEKYRATVDRAHPWFKAPLVQCRIQWIDKNGKPTPDTNAAIGVTWMPAHMSHAAGKSFWMEESEKFPICKEHSQQLSKPGMEHWKFEPYQVVTEKAEGCSDMLEYGIFCSLPKGHSSKVHRNGQRSWS